MPDGKLAVSTRRGEIYLVENPKLDGVRSANGLPLLHPETYHTVNAIPATLEPAR